MADEFPFKDSPDTAAFICTCVAEKEKPILYVTHDNDGYWQFLCGDNHTEKQAKIVSLMYAFKLDQSIKEVSDLDYGQSAYRKTESDKWIIN